MPFLSAHRFIHRRGIDQFYRFLDLCRRGVPLEEIAREFSISTSMVARLRKRFFIVEYQLRPAVAEAIENHIELVGALEEDRRERLRALTQDGVDDDRA